MRNPSKSDLRPDLAALVAEYPRARMYGGLWKRLDEQLQDGETVAAVAAGASGVALTDRRIVQVRGAGRQQDVLTLNLRDVTMVELKTHGTTASVAVRTDGPRLLVRTVMRDPASVFAQRVREAAGL